MKTQALNPYLPSWEYVPDGEPRVFGDRVYVYGSHDRFGAPIFCVEDYVCWSAPTDDLGDWRLEGTIFRKDQDPANPRGHRLLFAPDVVRGADGRYYLFYAFDFMGLMGVAVCDEPAGSYEFLGRVSWPDGTPYGRRPGDGLPFDPGVLVDDDGRVYLYTGFATHVPAIASGGHRCASDGGYVLELESDMHTIRGTQRLLFPKEGPGSFAGHEFFEASSIRKLGETYVFVYSSCHNHELCYATSARPDGDFEFGGTLVSLGDVGLPGHPDEDHAVNYLGNTHGSILRLPAEEADGGRGERYFVFYHRQTNRSSYARQACAEELVRAEDGRFLQAEVTSCGLNGGPLVGRGAYPAGMACNLWSASGAGRVDGTLPRVRLARHPYLTQEGEGEGARQFVANMRDGSVAGFKYFDLFGLWSVSVIARGSGRGRLLVAADTDFETAFASIDFTPTHDRWLSFSAGVRPSCLPEGHRTPLYFCYRGTGSVDLLSFTLEASSAVQ